MTKTKAPAIDTAIPDFLKRQTNAKGVTLSAGPATATGAKTAPIAKLSKRAEARLNKAAKAGEQAAIAKEAALAPVAKSTPVTAAPAVGEDGQPLTKVSRSIVPMKFKARYAKNNGVCGDDVSLELKAATTTRNADKREVLDVEVLWEIALANNIDVAKYRDLNNGQKRMNVGNKLRGLLAAGTDIIIGSRQFKAEDFTPRH